MQGKGAEQVSGGHDLCANQKLSEEKASEVMPRNKAWKGDLGHCVCANPTLGEMAGGDGGSWRQACGGRHCQGHARSCREEGFRVIERCLGYNLQVIDGH